MAARECEVCMEEYSVNEPDRVPKVMICGHTFCSGCLGKLIEDESIKCPRCRSRIRGIKTVADVRNNFTLIEVLVPPDESKGDGVHPKCKEHNRDLTLFCHDDETLVCQKCLTRRGSHAGHEVDDITDVLARLNAKFKEHMARINSHISELTECQNEITVRTTGVSRDCKHAKATIQKEVDEVIDLLNARKDTLFEEVEHNQKAEDALLQYEKTKVERSLHRLKRCRLARKLLKQKSDITAADELQEIVRSALQLYKLPQLHTELNRLKTDVNNIDVQFEDITEIVQSYGNVIASTDPKEEGDDYSGNSYSDAGSQEDVRICRNMRDTGSCHFGDLCHFSHQLDGSGGGRSYIPRSHTICYNFRDNGSCRFGDGCRFRHA